MDRVLTSCGRLSVALLCTMLMVILAGPTRAADQVSESGLAAMGEGWGAVGSNQLAQLRFTELLAVDQHLYDLASSHPGLSSVHAWSVQPERNLLVAYVQSVDQARSELVRAGVDLGKIEFEQLRDGLRFQPLACTRTGCTSEPIRGGLAWYTSRGGCTTGFGATRQGVAGFVSAGHCAARGSAAYLGRPPNGTAYGSVAQSVQSGDADGSFVARDANFSNGSRDWIYVSSSDPQHDITVEESSSGYANGERTCFAGMTSGYACGRITDGFYTDMSQGLRDVVLTDIAACGSPGDSGAPYFDGNSTAQGILSGALVDAQGRCLHGIYTKVSRVESALGAQIILG